MTSLCSGLGVEEERRLLEMFPRPVRFTLLYKASRHGWGTEDLGTKTYLLDNFVLLVYLKSDSVKGGFSSKAFKRSQDIFMQESTKMDEAAFVFSVSPRGGSHFPVLDASQALRYERSSNTICFGEALKVTASKEGWRCTLGVDLVYKETNWAAAEHSCLDVEVLRVEDTGDELLQPWRDVLWTETNRDNLRKNLVSYKPYHEELTQVRVLLLGPVGAGKSNFVSSIRSVLCGHVINLPIIGNGLVGFTKKLKSFPIRAEKGGPATALTLCDVMALSDCDLSGLTLHDALAVIKGHAPEGHKFQPEAPIQQSSPGYRLDPSLKDKIHCVLFTLNACALNNYSSGLKKTLRKLHRKISDLGVPQLVLLTHMDQVCTTGIQSVYTSRAAEDKMQKAAEFTGLPMSFVLPVKNYSSELAVDCDSDILLLSAANQILQAADDASEDWPQPQWKS